MPHEWRTREFHHIYSRAASALVSLLMWYELQPLSVAVGWAVFGVVLFEHGLLRKTRQFRFQAYLALSAAFGRIFFANLASGIRASSGDPRIYTVLPVRRRAENLYINNYVMTEVISAWSRTNWLAAASACWSGGKSKPSSATRRSPSTTSTS